MQFFVTNRLCLSFLFLLGFAGCSSVSVVDWSKSDRCCKSPTSISYWQVNFNESVSITLGNANSIIRLNERVVSVIPLALPADSADKAIIFRSYINGLWMPVATVLQPEFHFLNESKELLTSVKDIPLYQLWREPLEAKRILKDGYFGAINIPKNAAYLLVTSNLSANPLPYYRGAGASADIYLRAISRESNFSPLQHFIDGTASMPKFDNRFWNEFFMKPSLEGDLTIKVVAK
jgi:hypothetical protein